MCWWSWEIDYHEYLWGYFYSDTLHFVTLNSFSSRSAGENTNHLQHCCHQPMYHIHSHLGNSPKDFRKILLCTFLDSCNTLSSTSFIKCTNYISNKARKFELLPEASFGFRVLSLAASVCVCVCVCINHLLLSTLDPFKLGLFHSLNTLHIY